jgi:hypothetical protein
MLVGRFLTKKSILFKPSTKIVPVVLVPNPELTLWKLKLAASWVVADLKFFLFFVFSKKNKAVR